MDPDRRKRVEDVFDQVLDRPPQEWDEVLEELCEGDGALKKDVGALLAAHRTTEGILEEPLFASAWQGGQAIGGPAPDMVDRYRILGEIGKGGMGRVYLAERADGHFKQRVALKVIPRGDEALKIRVAAERQILASFQHPNIARLLDGGVTEDGRPYLVMEHVAGLPIDVYCDRMRLSLRERLRVFLTVLGAVEHAHHNLVVHRDLKPSNILVTPSGEVKLLDFGIAKLLDPNLGGADTPVTRTKERALTPEYASPEQVTGESITTASDIYSLGVILYELLTGARPYRIDHASLSDLLEVVCEVDPPTPSARVQEKGEGDTAGTSAGDEQARAAAESRYTTTFRLPRSLKGDLDAIAMKALRKEPGRRYTSVELFAQDIRHYLEGMPVGARRGSGWYRVQKFATRHRTGVLATLVVAFSLIAGAGTAAWQAGVASRERDRARDALMESEEITEFLLGLFEASDPLETPGDTVTVLDLLRRGEERARNLRGEPIVQARLLRVMARAHHNLGQYREAEEVASEAVELLKDELGVDHHEMAPALTQLGISLSAAGKYESARLALERALASEERWHGGEVPEMGDILENLARVTIYLGDLTKAEAQASRALSIKERFLGANDPSTLNTRSALASIYRYQGRYALAEVTFREVLGTRRELNNPSLTRLTGDMLQLGDVLRAQGRELEEAERLYLEAVMILRDGSANADRNFVWGLTSLAALAELEGDLKEAENLLSQAVENRRRTFGENHPLVAEALGEHAGFLTRHDRPLEGERLFRRASEIDLRTVGPLHSRHAGTLAGLARALMRQNKLEEADSLLGVAIGIRVDAQGRRVGRVADALAMRAEIRTRMGRYKEAEVLLTEAMETATELGTGGPLLNRIHAAFVRLYESSGQPEKAARHRVFAARDP